MITTMTFVMPLLIIERKSLNDIVHIIRVSKSAGTCHLFHVTMLIVTTTLKKNIELRAKQIFVNDVTIIGGYSSSRGGVILLIFGILRMDLENVRDIWYGQHSRRWYFEICLNSPIT
mmetsp:Transcript_12552/g.16601  ORF Transcript_12552/g.16601 Transcript_12552/m.16601 type:complete len:117 (-) Transcript_12552:120-470(-)